MAVNDFSDADFRAMPAAILAAEITKITTAIDSRVDGTRPEGAESYTINGRQVTNVPLKDLYAIRNMMYRAQQQQTAEPSGLGITRIRAADGGGSGGGSRGPYGRTGWGGF